MPREFFWDLRIDSWRQATHPSPSSKPSTGQVSGSPTCWKQITSGPAGSGWQDWTFTGLLGSSSMVFFSRWNCRPGKQLPLKQLPTICSLNERRIRISEGSKRLQKAYSFFDLEKDLCCKTSPTSHWKKKLNRTKKSLSPFLAGGWPPNMWVEAAGRPLHAASKRRGWKPGQQKMPWGPISKRWMAQFAAIMGNFGDGWWLMKASASPPFPKHASPLVLILSFDPVCRISHGRLI